MMEYPSGPIFNTEEGKIHTQQTEAPGKGPAQELRHIQPLSCRIGKDF